ncbi:CHASE2 domain-containing protein [Pyruvatibacter mobilis]|uniref:CHASE2 domain-containing protein n=1 Tax=Pyruvatibacter mobilis TaxID=1712261 RepID=UPI003BB0EA8C
MIAFLVAMGAYMAGALETLELGLLETRFSVLDRPATGDLVAVQIDARSIQELGEWPLSRSKYALVVQTLVDAGVLEIAIDVDMSARSDPDATALLAAALEAAGGHVLLPAFIQKAGAGPDGAALMDTRPEDSLLPHAWLASVNVVPDADGRLRRLIFGMDTPDGDFRYSMFALLAERARPSAAPFYVDFGIDVRSIPRVSFADVLYGRFDPATLRGKKVIIGGTAVELGDHFSVPRYGVMSGPMVQAMGFETLRQGREIHRTGPMAVILMLGVILVLSQIMPQRWGWRQQSLMALGAAGTLLVFSVAVQELVCISVDVVPGITLIIVCFGMQMSLFADAQQKAAAHQKRVAARQRILLDRVVADSFDGIAILDADGQIEKANDRTFELCGADGADRPGHVDALLGTLTISRDRPAGGWHLLPAGEAALAQCDTDDGVRHVELTVSRSEVPLTQLSRDGGAGTRTVYGLTVRDVTDRVVAARATEAAREEAERANRAKTDFLANMSHELRTPLNAVIGFAELMESEALGPLGNDDYREYAGDIHTSGRHLLSIVNDILDITRSEMGDLALNENETCLNELAEAAISACRRAPEQEGREIIADFDHALPEVLADPGRIQRCIEGLLSNALKFSDGEKKVIVRTGTESDGCPFVEVEDFGTGIPRQMLSSILMPFQQVASSRNRTSGGTGLGLTIVSAFMAAHDGKVDIESEEGEGTRMRLVLPAERSLARAPKRMDASACD